MTVRATVVGHGIRSSWILVGGTIVAWAFLLFGYNDSYPWLSLVEIVSTLIGFAIVIHSLGATSDRFSSKVGLVGLLTTSVVFFVWCWIQIRVAPAYGTDEAAFDQYAAQLFIHGINPYTHSMAPAFNLFHVSPDGHTFRMNGSSVTSLSYPALSFLIYVPFLLMGLSSQLAIFVNIAAWTLGIVVAYFLLPGESKPLALVLGSFAIYTGFAVGGVTDAVYVPLLILALYQWDRYEDRRGWHRWVSPGLLALSMSIKQTPWFIAPFLLVGLFLESRDRGDPIAKRLEVPWSYLWRLGAVFGLVNAYSLASDPIAWVKGVVTPFFDHLVPAGEGWVALSDFLGRGGGNLTYYTFLVLAVTIFCIVIFVYIYPRAKSLLVFFPSIVLFFASRSYSNYLVMLLLPALVTFTSVRPSPPSSVSLLGTLFSTRRRYVVLASAALIPLVALIITVTPQPLTLNINSVTTTGQLATVIEVQLVATNHTGQRITPVFASESGGAITAPWDVVQGPSSLAPHAHAVYALQAPNFFAQPSLTGGFQIVALTTTPEALSVSGPYVPTRLHVNLNPESFDRPLAAGSTITIQAQVLTPTNAPLQKSGIPVYLGQVSYTQQGLIYTQASINGSPVGATPVEAPTNRQGVATFNITDFTASRNPVYFEANLVDQVSSYPYGYSNIVTARFR